jgi:LacI family transcriptional regulator
VGVDDVHGGELAVAHLLEQGHRPVGFVGGPGTLPQVEDRLAGARRAVELAGLPPDVLVPLECEALTVTAGREAAQRLLGLPAGRRPTAIFCANDLVALGALQELAHRGARVPDDVAIVGYDDIDFAAAAAVPLTSVRQPRQLLGRTAVDLLLREAAADRDHVHEQIQFTPELVVRDSSVARR